MSPKNYRPIIVFAPNVLAGAEKVVITGTIALFELGLDPHLIIIKETRAPQHALEFIKAFPKEIKISIVESHSALDLKLVSKIWEFIKDEKKNIIVHTHGFKALVATKLIRKSFKHVHTHHGNTSHTFKVRVYEWLADMAMKRCDQVIAVSNEMQIMLLKTLSPYKKISVVINMLSFKNAPAIREAREQRKKSGKINLIFIGRLSSEKGLLPFLNNFSNYDQKEIFQVTILGDGQERITAEQLVQEKNLSSQVSFHGFVSNPSDYLKSADLLILPSLTEGLPMTLIESLASGVPVIGNDVGAIKSLLQHQKNGFLTASNDFPQWETAFNSALKELDQWQDYAMKEAPFLEETYSANHWALKTSGIYEKVISSNET
jgi:glycosyltransferase involved in cell wall biosynthesis